MFIYRGEYVLLPRMCPINIGTHVQRRMCSLTQENVFSYIDCVLLPYIRVHIEENVFSYTECVVLL